MAKINQEILRVRHAFREDATAVSVNSPRAYNAVPKLDIGYQSAFNPRDNYREMSTFALARNVPVLSHAHAPSSIPRQPGLLGDGERDFSCRIGRRKCNVRGAADDSAPSPALREIGSRRNYLSEDSALGILDNGSHSQRISKMAAILSAGIRGSR
jgi:hypothetical protein